MFRKQKKNIHTSHKLSQTSSNCTKDSGSQTLADTIESHRSNRDSRDYHNRPRSKERRSSRDEKSRKRSRSRDKRKRSRSSSRNRRYDSGRNNDKRPRINYPSSTESRYSQSKFNNTDDNKEEKPKVLGAYEDISPIKRKSGDATMHLYPTFPIELAVNTSKLEKTTDTLVNGNHLKEPVPVKLNFDPIGVIIQSETITKLKTKDVLLPQKFANTSKDCSLAEKLTANTIDKLNSQSVMKEAIQTVIVPSAPLSSIQIEPKNSVIPVVIVPKQVLKKSLKSPITFPKSPVVVIKNPVNVVKSPAVVIKSEPPAYPLTNLKSPVVVITSEPSASRSAILKSPAVVIKSEPSVSPTNLNSSTVIIKSEPVSSLASDNKTNGTPTQVSLPKEKGVETTNSLEVAEKVHIKLEPTSPIVWENSNSTYRKEIVDGAEVIKIIRKPRIKKRKNVVN